MPLTTREQLPELTGETLILTWDQSEFDTLILQGDTVIWRERTDWEVYNRFEEIATILKQKCGRRLLDIYPHAQKQVRTLWRQHARLLSRRLGSRMVEHKRVANRMGFIPGVTARPQLASVSLVHATRS